MDYSAYYGTNSSTQRSNIGNSVFKGLTLSVLLLLILGVIGGTGYIIYEFAIKKTTAPADDNSTKGAEEGGNESTLPSDNQPTGGPSNPGDGGDKEQKTTSAAGTGFFTPLSIGLLVGGLVLVVVVVGLVFFARRGRGRSRGESDTSSVGETRTFGELKDVLGRMDGQLAAAGKHATAARDRVDSMASSLHSEVDVSGISDEDQDTRQQMPYIDDMKNMKTEVDQVLTMFLYISFSPKFVRELSAKERKRVNKLWKGFSGTVIKMAELREKRQGSGKKYKALDNELGKQSHAVWEFYNRLYQSLGGKHRLKIYPKENYFKILYPDGSFEKWE